MLDKIIKCLSEGRKIRGKKNRVVGLEQDISHTILKNRNTIYIFYCKKYTKNILSTQITKIIKSNTLNVH